MSKRFMSVLVVITLILSAFAPLSSLAAGMPSSWAVNEVDEAAGNELVPDSVTADYQADITKEQFCELVMMLYHKLGGQNVETDDNKFIDTKNEDVITACAMGIVNGETALTFGPYNSIAREEICAMLIRAIGIVYPNIDLEDYRYNDFDDIDSVSQWAMPSVQFAYDHDIVRGIAPGKVDPQGNTTCEQAVLLINRIYKNRDDLKNADAESVKTKRLRFAADDELNSVSVYLPNSSNADNVEINEIESVDMLYSTTGIIGTAVDISSEDDTDKAVITFDYKPDALGETSASDLAVAWYNTDLNRVEILNSTVDEDRHTVSAENGHLGSYMLVDSRAWYSVWQRGQTIVRKTDSLGNYTEDFNVQLVADCSGSMSGDRIKTARQCTYDFIQKLSGNDIFSVIKFASSANTLIPATKVKDADMEAVQNTVSSMNDGGGTDFDAALTECIKALESAKANYSNIIVFLSDGESTVSDSILQTLKDNNVRIAAVALGRGANTSMMKKLADSTNGQYIYAEDSSDLNAIYNAIQGSLIGVDATDTDRDGIPDMIETTGMKNQYGDIIRTDPNKADTDGDGKSDAEEMGKLIETDDLTDMDRENGISKNVYFEMVSDPTDGRCVEETSEGNIDISITSSLNMVEGEEGTITASLKIDGSYAEGQLQVSSSDPSIIEVTETKEGGSGVMTIHLKAVDKGTARVSARYNDCEAVCKAYAADDGLDDGLKISAEYYGNTDKTGIFKVYVANESKEIRTAELGSGERFDITPAKTVKNAVVTLSGASVFEPIRGSAEAEISEINPGEEPCELIYEVRNDAEPGEYDVTFTVEAEGFETRSVDIKAEVLDTAINYAMLDTAKRGIDLTEKLQNRIKDKSIDEESDDIWNDFSAYFLSSALNLSRYAEITDDNAAEAIKTAEKVIYAMCDSEKAEELLDEIGGQCREELFGLAENKFREYIEENVPGGTEITAAAEQYKQALETYDIWVQSWNEDLSSNRTQETFKAFQEAYQLFCEALNQIK